MINNYVKATARVRFLRRAVSCLPADYDNVVRFEVRGEFSEGSTRPRINMEEAD